MGGMRAQKKRVLELDHAFPLLGRMFNGRHFMRISQTETRKLARGITDLWDESVGEIADVLVRGGIAPARLRETVGAHARAPALGPAVLPVDVAADFLGALFVGRFFILVKRLALDEP